nr:hypothetical protein [Tanacetum cinerariifolium]
GMPAESTYSAEAVRALDTHHRDLFSLIRAPNPTKVKTRSRPRASHEVPLLTLTANRVIEMEDPAVTTDSSGVPSTIERSPLDFANEVGDSNQGTMAPEVPPPEDVSATSAAEVGQAKEVAAIDPSGVAESRKRGHDEVKTGSRPRASYEVPPAPRVIEMDEPAATDSSGVPSTIERSPLDFAHEVGASDQGTAALEMSSSEDVPATAAPGAGSSHGGKSLAAILLGLASTVVVSEDAPVGVSDPDPLSFTDAPSRHPVDVAQSSPGIAVAGDPESENASSPAEVRSSGSVYQPEWGVTNGILLDTPRHAKT